ncbi:MAG: aspartyl-tRNA(Asn)/glutamyl-tRNA(Gln) amidotransferase subunit [Microbacteriaceae bacterium]|jgi:aspartyl-tRNA(Asn)/glutamyl-tRNA(Gln) amidotransferase subunit A|nr:aspartyl-tRNA(Asn)/glutamyl-tRNA(Gln) amidotransferase subunit [Microbacteriaceae bacterium]
MNDESRENTDGSLIARNEWAVAQLQTAMERLDRLGRPLNAVVTVIPAPLRSVDGPLLGMPIAVKDMIDVAGYPRGNGNPEDMAGPAAAQDAAIVTALRDSAADVFALAALLEYAAGAQHPELPEARNPAAPHLTAGGSSGGSAALVGAGVCPAALGTDTGGSIRLPAHYCGVVGFKPTFGTFPVTGVQPLSPTLDHVGILAKDVPTTAIVFESLTRQPGVRSAEILSVGVLADQFADPRLEKDVRDIVLAAVEQLRGRVVLEDRDGSALSLLNLRMGDIVDYEAWQVHGAAVTERPEHFGAPTGRRFAAAAHISQEQYLSALAERAELVPDALAVLEGVDFLLGPAAPYVAPEVSPPGDTPEGAIEGIFTSPYNMTGQPAIVIPCGLTAEGLPVGLQLAAAPGADAALLAGAAVIERILAEASL